MERFFAWVLLGSWALLAPLEETNRPAAPLFNLLWQTKVAAFRYGCVCVRYAR